MSSGDVVQVIGAVVDVQFPTTAVPNIYDALKIENSAITLEVQQQLGDGIVRTIALGSTDGLRRGMAAVNTGEGIKVPVGRKTLGRIMNVLGEPIDELGPIGEDERMVIHRDAPKFVELSPATELLEWLAPALGRVGGALVQAEDELASINMALGASYGGVPALTATSGPGLSLMIESLGLGVAAEIPVVVVDVMRTGPSTGIATKTEQADLNIALYGLHGDAPHLVVAPNSIADCIAATEWAVGLAESLQVPAIVLSDQYFGQARAVIDQPGSSGFSFRRMTCEEEKDIYHRYALTPSGVSPMAIPGTPGCAYTADGLEHSERGLPSSQARDHLAQMDKRARKLAQLDPGGAWASIEGDGDTAVITFGSCTGAVREALAGAPVRIVSLRLLSPAQPAKLKKALEGVRRVLVVEQNHGGQFLRYLRSEYELPAQVKSLRRPGPLPFRPEEIQAAL